MANISAETNSKQINHDEPLQLNDNETQSVSQIQADQNDSRITVPDGAQSPASSTYADCEDQNDNFSSENHSSNSTKENYDPVEETELLSNVVKEITACSKSSEEITTNEIKSNDESEINNNTTCDDNKNDSKPESDNTIDLAKDLCEDDLSRVADLPNNEYVEISDSEEDVYVEEELDNYYAENDKSDVDDEYSDGSSQHKNDRENGDGQEGNEEENAIAQKELDDDEDRRNPQYIPKRGFFYEHDDRTVYVSDDEKSEGTKKEAEIKESEVKSKGKRFIPDGRWQHDLYREDEQKPKSTQELIDMYGYDIRNEESAPKARRRRKYGRGPNKYTRKWNDEGAYAKQTSTKPFRGRNKTSFKKEDYDQDFPSISDKKKSNSDFRNRERVSSKNKFLDEPPKIEDKFKEDGRIDSQIISSDCSDRPRNYSKQLSNLKERSNYSSENYDSVDSKHVQKPMRNSHYVPSNDTIIRGRGRGIGHGKNVRVSGNYEEVNRLQFVPSNRGRGKRLAKQSQHFYSSKQIPGEEIHALTEQMSAVEIESIKRNPADKLHHGDSENLLSNESPDVQQISSNIRSKRYSHQRQRLLPEANKGTSSLGMHQNVQQNMQSITHNIQNLQNVAAPSLCQTITPTHTSMSLMTQNQCTAPPPQTVATPLSVTPASISSSSLAVSASLIPLSAPPLTASGPALSAAAPPLPIMGFFQHPQAGFTNQAAPAQLYSRDQAVMGAPSNQPVQLVAFLPASPILSNTNHSQSAPPPPPPPPPPGFPTTVMSYQPSTQTPQNAASFNSESYSMPPVTLAPIHQPPEVYQSRGGVTYYNTRSQVKPRSPPPPRVKTAIPIVPPPSSESLK